MANKEYTVTYLFKATVDVPVSFDPDPGGLTRGEIVERAIRKTIDKAKTVMVGGDSLGPTAVSVDGKQIWGGEEPYARLLGAADVGELFDVRQRTVYEWMRRYAESHPVPPPDYEKPVLLWWSSRIPEWVAWKNGLPGQGSGGGPKPKTPE